MLRQLSKGGERSLEDIARSASLPPQSVYYGLSLLRDKGLAILRESRKIVYALTPRGREALRKGLPEELLLEEVVRSGKVDLRKALEGLDREIAAIALGQAKSRGLVRIEGRFLVPTPKGRTEADKRPVHADLEAVQRGSPPEDLDQLLKRGLVESVERIERYASLTREGIAMSQHAVSEEWVVDLDPEMLRTGSWATRRIKPFDIHAPAPSIWPAKKQPYRLFLDRTRRKLISMGFVEMTGPLVELAFWNFDALFQAQNHPAREVHDTFRVKNPSHGTLPQAPLVARVKATHENGWTTGSTGWGYRWSEEEASRLVGRSQGTALSARTLASGIEPPAKHFSIARVFRPDVLDRTHLIEFNQCEGIIADAGLTFRHLLGVLEMFALEIAHETRYAFVPSYYPFTEPSVDLVAYSQGQGGWIELGGAGIFRDEVTKPLGVDIPVIAWGMGIDRLAMFSLGIDDIRELFSRNLEWLRSSKVAI